MNSCKCKSCGAEFLFSKNILDACLSCGEKNIINLNKNYNLPSEILGVSTVTKDEFTKKIDYILREGDFTPDDIIDQTNIYECIKLYVPYYKYLISYHCTFRCSVGYDKLVDYTDYVAKKDKNGREYKEPVHRQRKETDWRPYSSKFDGQKSFYHIASNRFYDIKNFIQKVSQCKQVYVDSNNVSDAIAIEKIEFSAKKIFDSRCTSELKAHVSEKAKKVIPGDHIRDLNCSSSYSIDSSDLKFKLVWIALCEYKGQLFRIFSDANDSEVHETVNKPVDSERVSLIDSIEKPLKYIKPLFIISIILMILSALVAFVSFFNGYNIIKFIENNFLAGVIVTAVSFAFSIFFYIVKKKIKNKCASIINESKRNRGIY
jgi:hypothetical protein